MKFIQLFVILLSIVCSEYINCHYCKISLDSEWVVLNDHNYHYACYQIAVKPNCNFCKKLISSEFVKIKDANYHRRCYKENIAEICSICKELIESEFLVDHWGNKFHKYHESNSIMCNSCTRIISDELTYGGFDLNDGRFICTLCYNDIIQSLEDLESARNSVLLELDKIGFKKMNPDVPIHLLNQTQLFNIAGSSANRHLKGFTEYSYYKLMNKKYSRNYKIYILSNLPTIEFEAVLAHEYIHIWQYENNVKLTETYSEGLCNLASELIYLNDNTRFSDLHIKIIHEDPDPVYGDGFRMMKAEKDKLGWNRFLLNFIKLDR